MQPLIKRFLLLLIFSPLFTCYSQAYIPMPSDSGATWRYRIYDIDYLTQVFDNIIFLNGADTAAHGNVYHKLMSRSCKQTGGPGFDPPIVPIGATAADIYYGAMRESGKQVFLLTTTGEELIYDFNTAVGDSTPAYTGKDKITAIDSVLLSDGVYHKRYLTTDTGYYVIEGVGSSRGLIPGMNDGSGIVRFYCLTNGTLTYAPDSTIPCTYIYPAGYVSGIAGINNQLPEIQVYPIPANDMLHITSPGQNRLQAVVFSAIGRVIWSVVVNDRADIAVDTWPNGVYYIRLNGGSMGSVVRKFVKE